MDWKLSKLMCSNVHAKKISPEVKYLLLYFNLSEMKGEYI
jgi:hypothetical protein